MNDALTQLPAVHRVLASPLLAASLALRGRATTRGAVRRALAEARERRARGEALPGIEELAARAAALLEAEGLPPYPAVVNASGVLIHTNLGRAPLAAQPVPGYLALELDLDSGERGERLAPVVTRLCRYFGCEAATVTTNTAAALVLLLAAQATGREVVVSRGELIEIGGSFRLPDIMTAAGARLVEVGCTNRTHLADYERAANEDTAAFLVVHRSNFSLDGFVATPDLADLVGLGRRVGIPVWVDQGSGCHVDLTRYGLHHETTAAEILAAGADVVLLSGDKLLGGPQAGIVLGREAALAPLRRHPLRRALRPDKSVLAGLAATLDLHIAGRSDEVPLYRLLAVPEITLRRRARAIAARLRRLGADARAVATRAVLGGGTTPDQTLPSWAIALPGGDRLAAELRRADPPVVARRDAGMVLVDLRAVPAEQDRTLVAAVVTTLTADQTHR